VDVLDDLAAEYDRIDGILRGLDDAAWLTESGAKGWTVADVVLHLAQSEEAVVDSTSGRSLLEGRTLVGNNVDEIMDNWVRAERAAPDVIFKRWQTAKTASLDALRAADPQQPLPWVAAPLKPKAMATTRLAEHWAHTLDIVGPLGVDYPDTDRLHHIAWLAHRTLPYGFQVAGEEPAEVYVELTAPDGRTTWEFGSPDAASSISGTAGAFCRVGAQRLKAGESGLETSGPAGATALRVLRNYAA
jgi:uncharacterized protein (TIGR03084 family)